MKKIKLLLSILLLFILGLSLTNATYTTDSSNGYNTPIIDGSIVFKAELVDGKVNTSWTKYNKDDTFKYYKVVRSQKVSSPIYPDNGYIKYTSDVNLTEYVDYKAPIGLNYYRVCAITSEKNRYCSNVVKIIKKTSSLKQKPKICTMEYAPVCGEKNGIKKTFGNKCSLESTGAKYLYKGKCKDTENKVIPKKCISRYDGCNTCGVKNGKTTFCTKRYCVRHNTPKCLKFEGNIKPIKITEKMMKKADYLVDRFIKKLEEKYKTDETRLKVLKVVIKRLDNLKEKKPRAKYLIEYLNKKLAQKISVYEDTIKDVEEIFNEY